MFQGMHYVYEVYKHRSFSKAAASLFVSQPALSATVIRIEKRIGYPIFDRSTKPLSLTQCGQRYIAAVEEILAAEKGFADFVNDWENLQTGELVLGGSSFFSSWVLPPLIAEFSRRYPKITVAVREENTVMLEQKLQEGSVDFILDNCELDSTVFDHFVLEEESLLLAVPRIMPVNETLKDYQVSVNAVKSGAFVKENMPAVPMEAFQNAPFVLLKEENDTGKRALDICQENRFHPKVLLELDQQMTAYNTTCAGMGISFIGDMLISRVPYSPDVIYYKLQGKHCRRKVCFYWKRGRYVSRAMEAFLKLVAEVAQDD